MSSYLIGEKSLWQQRHGDLVACGEYVTGPGGREAAMVIFPMGKATDPTICPVAICLSALYKWLDPVYAAREGARCAQALGMQDSSFAVTKLIDVVMAHIDDVVGMPPEKLETDAERRVVAEVSYKAQGVVREREILAGELQGSVEITGS